MKILKIILITFFAFSKLAAQNATISWNSYEFNSNFYNGYKIKSEIGRLELPENRKNLNNRNKVELALVSMWQEAKCYLFF
jgi:hypothetical protein